MASENEQLPLANLRERRQALHVGSGIAALLLVAALADWPYGYYISLRWVTTLVAILVIYTAYLWARLLYIVPFAAIAILFNPIVPVHLDRETWAYLDVGTAALFVLGALLIPFRADRSSE